MTFQYEVTKAMNTRRTLMRCRLPDCTYISPDGRTWGEYKNGRRLETYPLIELGICPHHLEEISSGYRKPIPKE